MAETNIIQPRTCDAGWDNGDNDKPKYMGYTIPVPFVVAAFESSDKLSK